MTLRVLDPGLYTLVVDFGRPGWRSLGVPVGGAADRASLALGNALVGNPPDAAALEITLAGPTLEAECELACAVYGAGFELTSDRQGLRAGKTFTLHPGEQLRLGSTHQGMRGYFCVRGGLAAPLVLGSRSSLHPLAAGVELPCRAGRVHGRYIRDGELGDPFAGVLRVVDAPQTDWFSSGALFGPGAEFEVSAASNRMGICLQGEPLRLPRRELVSEPVCPGTVQVPPDGQCIVLGVDAQTIGGYPKIAQVIASDLDRLGQLRPGDRVRFQRVELEQAERLYRERRVRLHEWVIRLRTAELFLG
jgi:antagonist of KipI